jgi:hypothetical protein
VLSVALAVGPLVEMSSIRAAPANAASSSSGESKSPRRTETPCDARGAARTGSRTHTAISLAGMRSRRCATTRPCDFQSLRSPGSCELEPVDQGPPLGAALQSLLQFLHVPQRALVIFAAATGLRPGEWIALEQRDIDRAARVVYVRRAFPNGRIKCPKTEGSIRAVPLQAIALDALAQLPAGAGTDRVGPRNSIASNLVRSPASV